MFLKTFKNCLLFQKRTFSAVYETNPNSISPKDLETKLLKVAIIGLPNAGKSTLINCIMDRKVCPTSMKVHTTRKKAIAIFTEGNSQIVFLDTPGLINEKEQKKYNLEKTFIRDSKKVSHEADIIGVIHDVSNVLTRERLDIKIINILSKYDSKPSFLVFNKVDILKSKRKLLDLARQVTNSCLNGKSMPGIKPLKESSENKTWPNFSDIFMVSALTGDGMQDVKNFLVQNAKPGEWMFPENTWTDQSTETIIITVVKAAFLDFIPQEIPYKLIPELEYLKVEEDGTVSTLVNVNCPTERIAKLVAGEANGKLRQITERIQRDLQESFHNYVKVRIVLKYPENVKK